MLFKQRLWAGLADGTVTCTFRRWRRPLARPGGHYRTPAGVLRVDAVAVVDPAGITDDDARRAGFAGRAELLRELNRHGDARCTGSTSGSPDPTRARRCARRPPCPRRPGRT